MYRAGLCSALGLLLATTFAAAQLPYVQLGGGGGIGAHYSSGSTDRGAYSVGALGFGLEWRRFFVRADARAFDTEAEPLLTFGLALGIPALRAEHTQVYVLAGAGTGFFAEEGDPGQHVGTGIGLTTGRLLGLYAELRYDYLLGTFIYASRQRSVASLVAGVRIGRHAS